MLRGITLDIENAKKLQYEKFKELVENFVKLQPYQFENYVLCNYARLGPNPDSSIYTKHIVKKYSPHNQKSLIDCSTFIAYPFGYK